MHNKLRNLIKRCIVSLASKDEGEFPVTQIKYFDDSTSTEYLYPYGAHGVPPNGSVGIMFNANGYAESNLSILYNAELRPKGLEPGEYASGNFQEESFTTYLNDGSITIKSKNGSSVTLDDNGDMQLVNGNGSTVSIEGAKITVKATNIELDGEVTITGNLVVDGTSITSDGVEVGSKHTHSGSVTAPTGSISPTGVPIGEL